MGYNKITKTLPSGHGHWKIFIEFKGEEYFSTTCDMPTLDKYKSDERGWKTAGNKLYSEVVRKNKLR